MKKMKLAAMLMAIVMAASLCSFGMFDADTVQAAENKSQELMVFGNKIVLKNDPQTVVRLSGVNIPGGEWTGTPGSENLARSITYAIDNWNCNFLRLSVGVDGWYGNKNKYSYVNDGGASYRNYIDSVIQIASEKGAYVILDLHHYKGFSDKRYLDFWQEAAVRYKNNPTVLFGILNEPHGISWEIWRNGGSGYTGHQQVVEMIRDLGARNIIVAGGLDYAYDLTGIANGYALVDQGSNNNKALAGNGIMYDTHIYPWKGHTSNWHNKVGAVRKEHPVVVGECGWEIGIIQSIAKKNPKPGDPLYHDKWCPELLDWINDIDTYGNYANLTAYCMHPSSSPQLITSPDANGNDWKNANYSYTPTDYWGVYVKEFLDETLSTRYTSLGPPTKIGIRAPRLYYNVGESFDAQNGEIMAYDENDNFYTVPFSDKNATITGFDSSKAVQSQTITVDYLGVTTKFEINITEKKVMGPDTPTAIDKKYLSLDFEDAVADSADSLKFNMTNKADGSAYSVQTYQNSTSARNVNKIMTNSTKYLMAPPKSNAPIDFVMPSAITKEDGRVYVDMRLYRASTVDNPVTVSLVDSNDNSIFTIEYLSGSAPSLVASEKYSTGVNYPVAVGGRYVRAIINFDTKTFELYQGDSLDNLTNFVAGKTDFSFENSAAADISRITNHNVGSSEGSIGYDDIDIYTVNTEPKYQWGINGINVIDAVENYRTYDELNTEVGTIQVFYANGIIEEIPLATEGVEISGFDSMIDGFQTLTVRYRGYTTTYQVFVTHYTYMVGIEASGLRDTYGIGDTFDRETGIINIKYSDGTFESLPLSNAGVIISGFNSTYTGTNTLKITYGSFETTFKINIVPDVSSITVTGLKSSYSADEPVDGTTAWINVNYIDGTTGKIRLDQSGATIVKRANAANNTITVAITYKNRRYLHTATLVDSPYPWQLTMGTVTKVDDEIYPRIACTVTLSEVIAGGACDADMIVYVKDATGKVIAVDIYPISAEDTSCDVDLIVDADFSGLNLHCVLWDSAETMEPVAYPVYKK